jgi:hypothetical protein
MFGFAGMEFGLCNAAELLPAVIANERFCLFADFESWGFDCGVFFVELFDGFVGVLLQPVEGGLYYLAVSHEATGN